MPPKKEKPNLNLTVEIDELAAWNVPPTPLAPRANIRVSQEDLFVHMMGTINLRENDLPAAAADIAPIAPSKEIEQVSSTPVPLAAAPLTGRKRSNSQQEDEKPEGSSKKGR